MDLIATKILVAILCLVIRFTFGIVPTKIYFALKSRADGKGEKLTNQNAGAKLEFAVTLVQSFGSGVLFATCFLHMIPEVCQSLQLLLDETVNYPYSELIISVGFFTIYFVEEAIQWVISRETKKESCKEDVKARMSSSKGNQVAPDFTKIPSGMAFEIKKKENFEETNQEQKCQENEKNFGDNLSVNTVLDYTDEEVQTDHIILENNEENINTKILEKQVKTEIQIMRCFIMVTALSFDAILEGLLIGLQKSVSNIWYLFAVVSVYSASVLFSVNLEVFLAGRKEKTMILQLLLLSCMTPFGVLLGAIISVTSEVQKSFKSWGLVVVQGLCAGTILYVTFFETLNREKERRTCRASRSVCIVAGFALQAFLECLKADAST